MTEDLHQEGEADATLQNGSNSVDASDDFSWLEDDTVTDDVKLKVINELEGKVQPGRKYKSLEDYEKSRKEALKAFSQIGRQQQEVPPVTTPNDLEVMFYDMNPDAKVVDEDLSRIARSQGISKIQAWKQEEWLREKAKAITDEDKRRKADAKRVLPPSSGASAGAVDYYHMSDEEILNLPPSEAEKALKAKAGRI